MRKTLILSSLLVVSTMTIATPFKSDEDAISYRQHAYSMIATNFSDMADFEFKFLWVENSNMTISAEKGNLMYARVTGSKYQEQAEILLQQEKHFHKSIDSIHAVFSTLERNDLKRRELGVKQDKILNSLMELQIDYIQSNPNYMHSVNVLKSTMYLISKDETQILFDNLSENIKQTKYGLVVEAYLDQNENFNFKTIDSN